VDYVVYISTPAHTGESAPLKTRLYLSKGRLTGGFLYFPRGPTGYLHFIAKIGTHQIAPYNIDQSYRLNGCVVPLYLNIDLFEPPFIIDCITWNDSLDFVHAMTAGFFLDPWQKRRTPKSIVGSIFEAATGYLKGGDRKA